MGGGGVCRWQEEEKQVKTGTGAGRVEEVGKMGGWRKWGGPCPGETGRAQGGGMEREWKGRGQTYGWAASRGQG